MCKKFLLNRKWSIFNRQWSRHQRCHNQPQKMSWAWQTMPVVLFCSGSAKDFTQWQYWHRLRGHNTPSAPKRYWTLASHARLHMWAIKISLNHFLQPKLVKWQIQSVRDFTEHSPLGGQPVSSCLHSTLRIVHLCSHLTGALLCFRKSAGLNKNLS